MDPEAAAAADQWVKEHPEEWKELEHMLYYSEANFHKRVAPDTLEDVDIKQPQSYNPEAFLPEEVRNAIYNDRRGRFCSARSSMANPLNPSHRTNSVRPETSGISELVRFDRYGQKSKDVNATAVPTLSSLFCCLF